MYLQTYSQKGVLKLFYLRKIRYGLNLEKNGIYGELKSAWVKMYLSLTPYDLLTPPHALYFLYFKWALKSFFVQAM